MLYLIYGSNTREARAKKDNILSMLRRKRPDAEVFMLDSDSFAPLKLESLYSLQGLFEQKHIVVLDGVLSHKDTKDGLVEALPHLSESPSVFLLLDGALDPKTIGLAGKHATKIFSFGEKKKEEKDNTAFLIADALMAKDQRGAWVNYHKALRAGLVPEAIHGAIFWKAKTIWLEKKTGGRSRFAKNFSEKELDEILSRLVDMYHEIRLGGGELPTELEKFLLEK